MTRIDRLTEGLIEAPTDLAQDLVRLLRESVLRRAKAEFRSPAYLWEAIDAPYGTERGLFQWALEVGECWLFCDRAPGRVWRVSPNMAGRFKREDAYLIPCADPSVCYVSPHEATFGPFILPFEAEDRTAILGLFNSGLIE